MNKKTLTILKVVAMGVSIGVTLLTNFISDKEQKIIIAEEVAKALPEKN